MAEDAAEKARAKFAEAQAKAARNAELARRAVVKKAQDAGKTHTPLVGN